MISCMISMISCIVSMISCMISMPSCRKCMFPQYLWRGIGPNIGWPKDRAVAKRSADISSKVDQGRVKVPKQLQRSKVDPSFRPGEYLLLLNNNALVTCSTTRTSGQRESFFQSRDENESFSDSISFIETRPRIPDSYSQASRRDREKISSNLGHRDEIEIYYLHSQTSRREREFP